MRPRRSKFTVQVRYSICPALIGTGADADTEIATDIATELCTGGGSDDGAYFYADTVHAHLGNCSTEIQCTVHAHTRAKARQVKLGTLYL